jgi:DnaJ family protein C protein 16
MECLAPIKSFYVYAYVAEFVRNKLPYRLIQTVTDDGLDEFLSGWVDNKVRAIVFQRQEPVRLRYLLTAFAYRDRVTFAYVHYERSEIALLM